MSKFLEKESSDTLYRAIVSLQDVDECRRFLQDLCTVSELKAMEQRMEVAMLLDDGLIYSDILERTGASSATISRVNRCLHYGADGYQAVIPRLKEQIRTVSSYGFLAGCYDELTYRCGLRRLGRLHRAATLHAAGLPGAHRAGPGLRHRLPHPGAGPAGL